MSSSRYSAIRSLLSRLSLSTARPVLSNTLDTHHASSSIDRYALPHFSTLALTSPDRSIGPYPGSPTTPKDSAFASPTTTRAPSPIADLEHLPYIPSDVKPEVPSALSDASEKPPSQDVAQPQQIEVVVPRARPRLWCSFVIYCAIGWGDGGKLASALSSSLYSDDGDSVTGTALPCSFASLDVVLAPS